MKKYICYIVILFITKYSYSQTWSNDNQVYFVSKIDTTFTPFSNSVIYCSKIDSKYFSWSWSGIFLYNDLSFETKTNILQADFPRYLYKAANDTMYELRIQIFQPYKRYYYFENDTLKSSYVNTTNDYNKMWMGNYYIHVNFKDSNNLKIINRQEQVIDQETFTFENNFWENKPFYLFLSDASFLFVDSTYWPNFKLQLLGPNSLIYSFALQDSLGNLPTLYSYKISYIDSTFQVSQVAKFENFPLLNMYEFPEIPERFYFNDITFTPNLDTIIISVLNNKSDSVYLPIGQNGYTINPTTRGHYVFTLNEPNSINENTLNNQIQLFPNPSKGKQTINITNENKKPISVRLIDFSGRVIKDVYKSNNLLEKTRIDTDISNLAPSIYYYEITIGEEKSYVKAIKH